MVKYNLYNKIDLREHPDLSPEIDSSFSKGHSFIYPGDEVVMHASIIGPDDLTGGPLPGQFLLRTLVSAKMSVIAKKPNIFTEQFDIPFASTREFELDSFTISFNNTNAPFVSYGSDGYAYNINFAQDRTWQLPSGDFRRQVKAYTEYTKGTPQWKYNFLFPFIFREEYWNALTAADSDFYDPSMPQNGQNQKWLRYHNLSAPPFGWKIFCRFEFKYTTIPFFRNPANTYVATAELDLSPDQDAIRDYQTNPDFKDLAIKTCVVGGTPSNTPKPFVFGNVNTSVFGYFTKKTAWDTDEKLNLVAAMRIRPFENGDRLGSRGSSVWPATPDVVWSSDTSNLDTDGGDDITTSDGGDNLIINDSGIPLTISFDPMDDKNVIVQGEIDYNKLNTIFPGINNFTIYCRLYNGTVLLGESKAIPGDGGITMTGDKFVKSGVTHKLYSISGIPSGYALGSEVVPTGWSVVSSSSISGGAQTITFSTSAYSGTIILSYTKTGSPTLYVYFDVYSNCARMGEEIKWDGVVYIPPSSSYSPPALCDGNTDAFVLDVFADTTLPTNYLNNDKSGFYFYGDPSILNITMQLQKNVSGTWTTLTTIIDQTLGKFFAFGTNPDFSGNAFSDIYNKQYTGILLDWLTVFNTYSGGGEYRMKIKYDDVFGNTTYQYSKAVYCLKKYDCYNMDGYVRIDTWNEGFRGTLENPSLQIDYAAGWADQIRLKGIFYESKPDYIKEFNQYGDQEFNALRQIIHEAKPKFLMDIRPIPGWLDWYLSNFVLLADEINITDYNAANRKQFVFFPVINGSGIDTKDENFINPLAWSQISFDYGQNNLRKRIS